MSKNRLGFVSNSSSSSFIISANSIENKIKVEIDLLEFIKNCGEYDENGLGGVAKNKQQLDEYFKEHFGCYSQPIEELLEESKWLEESYNKALQEIDEGKAVIFCDIGYDKAETFEILRGINNIKFIAED